MWTLTWYVPDVVSSLFGAETTNIRDRLGKLDPRSLYHQLQTGLPMAEERLRIRGTRGTLFGSFLVESPEETPAAFVSFDMCDCC